MDWISSWFYTTPAPTIAVIPAEASTTSVTEVAITEPSIPVNDLSKTEPETESNPPELIPHPDPDPDEFSPEADSKYQTKSRATQEYARRCSKRARNKARRARDKGRID